MNRMSPKKEQSVESSQDLGDNIINIPVLHRALHEANNLNGT
jgi:hypothetical protein